jgi:hypothetical protein
MSDRLARVLAHPLRDRVLLEYQGEPACASEVAARLDRPVNLVSYHTRVLVRHGCLELVRTERRRGADARYFRATVAQYIDNPGWRGLDVTRRRSFALNTLGRVADEARRGALAGAFEAPQAHLSRSPVELDDEGMLAVSGLLRRTFDEITRIAEASHARSGDRRPQIVVMLAFEHPASAPVPPDRLPG